MPELSCDQERWLPVVGWADAYEVSSLGRLRCLDRAYARAGRTQVRKAKVLCLPTHWTGYRVVSFYVGPRKRDNKLVHRLVLEAFVGPCPPEHECCHRNGDKGDNRLDNLYWGTRSENALDTVRLGKNPGTNKTHCPRGHELVEPNLVAWLARKGGRRCRACFNAGCLATQARRYGRPPVDVATASDRIYAESRSANR